MREAHLSCPLRRGIYARLTGGVRIEPTIGRIQAPLAVRQCGAFFSLEIILNPDYCHNCGEDITPHNSVTAQVEGKGPEFRFCSEECREIFLEIYTWQGENLVLNTD